MTNSQVAQLLGFSLLLSAGQALFKMAAITTAKETAFGRSILSLLQLPVFWSALVLYGSATLLWVYILQSVPLSRAYPFAALGFLVVPALSVLLFGERITATYAVGAALIVAGILITARA